MDLLSTIKLKAKSLKKTIVYPESYDPRILKAASSSDSKGIAKIILLGEKEKVKNDIILLGIKNIEEIEIVNHLSSDKREIYADLMVEIRKDKGLSKDEALKMLDNPLCYAVMMVKNGDADGEVAGAANYTNEVLRPAFQFVKTKPSISVVSGAFIMMINSRYAPDGMLIFADCAVNPNPNSKQLAEIAVSTAYTAKNIAGIEPKVSIMSFSTKGSAKNEIVQKVIDATNYAKEMAPEFEIDGELQSDASIVPEVATLKAKGSIVAGRANVLIFPSLEAGNISYKLVERLAGAKAVGPILQGLNAPINDLSRGCSVEDIVNVTAITVLQTMQ